MLRRVLVISAAVLVSANVSASGAKPYKALPDVTAINSDIDRFGPAKTLGRLAVEGQSQAFDAFLEKLEEGDVAWIKVATRLRPASDAGTSLMIEQSITLALPKSPAAVLRSVTAKDDPSLFSLQEICSGVTFLEDEPRERVAAWYQSAEVALTQLQEPELNRKRTQCLEELRKGRKEFNVRAKGTE